MRAVVLTDLHNPTGVRLARPILDVVAAHSGAHLLVDEVYLEFISGDPPPTAYREGAPVVVTRSLTKAFGLGWLRSGWAIAPAAVAVKMRVVRDYLGAAVPAPAAAGALAALGSDERLRAHAGATARAGGAVIAAFAARTGVPVVAPCPEAPVLWFPRLGADDAIAERARERHDTAVAPGALFGAPGHVRIAACRGVGC